MEVFDLRQIAAEYANLPAVISRDGTVTFRQLAGCVEGTREQLRRDGVRAGEPAAIVSGSSSDMIMLILALIGHGAVAVPLSTRLPGQAIRGYLGRLACRYVFTAGQHKSLAEAPGLRIRTIASVIANQDGLPDPMELSRRCNILFTSGSGGVPKAALHVIGNHYYSALGANSNIELGAGDKWLLTLPLFHIGGLAVIFRCLLAGAAVVVPDPELSAGRNIARFNITHLSMVGTQLNRLLREGVPVSGMHRLRAVLLGGGPVSRRLVADAFRNGLPVYTSYGSTEMSSQITTTLKNDPLDRLYTAGRVLPHRELKISAEGEILVRGRTLFAGYVDRGQVQSDLSDGWLRTGDVGSTDALGYLHISGRRDSMFISGGENIHPEEIERVLMEMPEIGLAMVVDIPDREFGARPFAFLDAPADLPADKIRSFLAERIERYKIPVHFVTETFRQGGLKYSRSELRQRALNWLKDQSAGV